jgi:peptidoglycan/LPS O-acetylase OafA/YrhL
MIKYRPDIDGLRAIAVLSVVFFHSGIAGFAGGFVGVDIFFVISGYLITQILIREMTVGTFSLANFYVRRILRIMPALIAVVLFTVVVGFYLLPPSQYSDHGTVVRGVATITANHYFMHVQADYWNQNISASQPLLHTWSLVVEEQFYIIFPLLLFLLFFCFKSQYFKRILKLSSDSLDNVKFANLLLLVISLLAISSLIFSQSQLSNNTLYSFYFAPSRAWELLLGGLIAIYSPVWIQKKWAYKIHCRQLACSLGLAMIIFAIVFFDSRTSFPGFNALLPCFGAVLIILSGSISDSEKLTTISKFLGNRIFVFIGLISYSLYLWHWPILVFVKSLGWAVAGLKIPHLVFQIIVMLLISWASWRFIEQPFRKIRLDNNLSVTKIISAGFLGLILLFVLGDFVTKTSEKKTIFTQPLSLIFSHLETDSIITPGIRCEGSKLVSDIIRDGGGCLLGNIDEKSLPSFVLIGDSHARMYTNAVDLFAKQHNLSALLLSRSSCTPLLGLIPPTRRECLELTKATIDYLIKSPIKHVVLAGYWIDILATLNTPQDFEDSLKQTIDKLEKSNKVIYIMLDVPELNNDNQGMESALNSIKGGKIPVYGVTLKNHKERQKEVNEVFKRLKSTKSIKLLDPSAFLCNSINCVTAKNGRSMYRDKHHLTDNGVIEIKNVFLPIFNQR